MPKRWCESAENTSHGCHKSAQTASSQSALPVVGYGSPGDLSVPHSPPPSPHHNPTPPSPHHDPTPPSPHYDPTPPPSPCHDLTPPPSPHHDLTPPPSPHHDPTPPHDPGSPFHDLSYHPDIPLDHGDHTNIFYQCRTQLIVNIEALSQSAILPHM
ncbi:hypothetical protein EDC04DRAFT_2891477 [Pisolithus marmoratus]|nr:hypothetical protein EDC04DRAFT_2891477 [Pisolithus marmoratus]